MGSCPHLHNILIYEVYLRKKMSNLDWSLFGEDTSPINEDFKNEAMIKRDSVPPSIERSPRLQRSPSNLMMRFQLPQSTLRYKFSFQTCLHITFYLEWNLKLILFLNWEINLFFYKQLTISFLIFKLCILKQTCRLYLTQN